MNYLVHLYLSDPQPLCRLGNLMGDFVKGRLVEDDWHPELLRGLRQHRAIDRLSHDHPAVRSSKACLDDRFGILKPVMIDIFYDHFLAKNWDAWGRGTLEGFAEDVYRLLEQHRSQLPEHFRPVARRMAEHDWLSSYRDPAVIRLVLERVGMRLSRRNQLAEGFAELECCGTQLERDCQAFLLDAANSLAMDAVPARLQSSMRL